MPFLQRQRWFGGKARADPRRRGSSTGGCCAGRRSRCSSRSSRWSTTTAGVTAISCRSRSAPHADASGIEERAPHGVLATRHRRAQRRAVRRLARRSVRARAARGASNTGAESRRGGARMRALQTAAFRRAARHRAICRPRRVTGRAEQHVADLRRSPDPEAVPPARARAQSGLRDRRYLTEKVGFTRVPAVAGALEYTPAGGSSRSTVGVLQQLVDSQADGWRHATDELGASTSRSRARRAACGVAPPATCSMLARRADPE